MWQDEELARGLSNSRFCVMISHFLQILHFFSIILHSNITTAVISLLMTACQEDFTTVVQTAKVWNIIEPPRKQLRKVLNVWNILYL